VPAGFIATFQFLGAFIGGAAGGSIYQYFGLLGVGIFCTVLLVCWFAISFGMQPPPQQQSVSFTLGKLNASQADGLAEQLSHVNGVEEVRIVADEQTVYLKVHKTDYNDSEIEAHLAPYRT